MTDLEALFASVLAHPAEDTPRLLLADALDERGGEGDAERAEYIRAAVGQAALERDRHPECRVWQAHELKRRDILRARCAALLAAHESAWRRPPCRACGGTGRGSGDYLSGRTIDHSTGAVSSVRPSGCPKCDGHGHTGGVMGEYCGVATADWGQPDSPPAWNIRATWTRGFISGVTLRWGQWVEWRADIRARWPVTDVQVVGAAVIPHEAVWVGANVWTDPAFPGITFRFA